MKKFMDKNFLLSNDTSMKLYHDYAEKMPIIDYHCHISPKEIYENKHFKNITEVWLYGDHYKWRAMRSNGIDEKYITGDGDDYSKFMAWAKTVPMTIGNPLYHWTHMELQKYFGIHEVFNEDTAPAIWEKTKKMLNSDELGVRNIIEKSNVKVICTTDDPTDSLEYHIKLKEDRSFNAKVLPAMRPDNAIRIEKDTFAPWVKKLEIVSKKSIKNIDDFTSALQSRIEFFHFLGCRLSDHALDYVYYEEASKEEINNIFQNALNGQNISEEDVKKYKTYILKFLGKSYAKLNWTMQLHMSALRNVNTKVLKDLGPDTGYDSINDVSIAYPLSKLLDSLEMEDSLPKMILYTANPIQNYTIAAMIENFNKDIPGKVQFGAAWWFNDNIDGMTQQMKALANNGLLSRFVGMLTDSRSFLSYTRHDYFRRILCNMIGTWVENGEAPYDMELLGKMVQDISYNNAERYFNM